MSNFEIIGIGKTPVKRLVNIERRYGLINVDLFAKLENTNLTGSIKDRTVYQMLLDDFKSGRIKEGYTVIEATSGNTGISLAALGAKLNLNVIIVMPTSMSIERRNLISSYGAKLVLVEGGMAECNNEAIRLQKETPNSVILGQFDHESNAKAHYLHTGEEIAKGIRFVDYVFAGIGSGGTISGIGQYMVENKPNVKCIGVEPEESPLITKGIAGPHLIQGIGANFIPKNFKAEYVDEVVTVKGEDAIKMSNEILESEGINVGYSSGANLLAAINYVKANKLENVQIVVIFPDDGGRYR